MVTEIRLREWEQQLEKIMEQIPLSYRAAFRQFIFHYEVTNYAIVEYIRTDPLARQVCDQIYEVWATMLQEACPSCLAIIQVKEIEKKLRQLIKYHRVLQLLMIVWWSVITRLITGMSIFQSTLGNNMWGIYIVAIPVFIIMLFCERLLWYYGPHQRPWRRQVKQMVKQYPNQAELDTWCQKLLSGPMLTLFRRLSQ